jgi:hypothetical protein
VKILATSHVQNTSQNCKGFLVVVGAADFSLDASAGALLTASASVGVADAIRQWSGGSPVVALCGAGDETDLY